MKKILLGNEAIVEASISAGVNFVSGYPGCPSAEIGDIFGKIAKQNNVYYEQSTNEKVALEAAIGASFSGLKTLIDMKSFGMNVCSDSMLPLAYTGVKGGMIINVGDDPSCHSSAQSEQNSRAYAYLSHIPMLEPSDAEECYSFTKLGFELSEKFNIPVILRTTTRVAHQKGVVNADELKKRTEMKTGDFVKNPHQFCTMPPRVLEMKKELLEKIEKIKSFISKSNITKIEGDKKSKIGIISSGISYLHVMDAQQELGLNLASLKLGFFYPLPEEKIKKFLKPLKKVLVVEEMDPYLEKEITRIAKDVNPKLLVFGKNVLPEIGELSPDSVLVALAKVTGKKLKPRKEVKLDLPRRYPRLCEGCPYWNILPTIKRLASQDTVFGGDIGCNMIAGLPPHNMQDYLFCMGASMGISHGVSKSTNQKVISIIGDGTFFHSGIAGLINAVYNKSNILIVVLDNRIAAMTGHQPNPGMGKTGMWEDTTELKIEDIARACGVKNVKVIETIKQQEIEDGIKEFLDKKEVSVIIYKKICALLERRQNQ